MNPAHLHLILTHLPVLGPLFGLGLLCVGQIGGSAILKRTSLWVFFLAGVSAVPTYLSGSQASGFMMKMMAAPALDVGDQHAEIAILALSVTLFLALVSLVGLIVYRKSPKSPGWFFGVTLALALAASAGMIWTASLGGQIRHPEIRNELLGTIR